MRFKPSKLELPATRNELTGVVGDTQRRSLSLTQKKCRKNVEKCLVAKSRGAHTLKQLMSLGGSLAHVGIAIEGHRPFLEEVGAGVRVCYKREAEAVSDCTYHTHGTSHPFNLAMDYFVEKLSNSPERFLANPYFNYKTGKMVALRAMEITTDDAPRKIERTARGSRAVTPGAQ